MLTDDDYMRMAPIDALRDRLRRDETGMQANCTHSLGVDQCCYCGAPVQGPERPRLKLVGS